MTASIEMPRYQCHKRVHALQIASVSGHRLSFVDKPYAPIDAPAEMFSRYQPKPGDYYVVYDGDGYTAFSPQAAFEAGYSKL